MRQLSTRLIEFAKTNSGALIIGVSLIIGLNFNRFTNYANLAIYHLSGQAGADAEAARAALAAEEEREGVARAKLERERVARAAEEAAWHEFLIAERLRFPQKIAVVENSYGGDFLCMRLSETEEVSSYEVRDNIADDFLQWLNSDGLLNRRDWKYDDIKGYADQSYIGCSSANRLWRANRYQKRIE